MISESMKLLRSEVLKLLLMISVAGGLAYAVILVTAPDRAESYTLDVARRAK